jgi:two-component system OmpR family sensor kinase
MTPAARALPQPGVVGRVRALQRRTPLSVTLVAALLVLLTLALCVTGVAATTALKGHLVDRVDEDLQATAVSLQRQYDLDPSRPRRQQPGGPMLPSKFVVQFATAEGALQPVQKAPFTADEPEPELPGLTYEEAAERAGQPFAASGEDGTRWRAVAVPLPDLGGSVMVASNLEDVETTIGRLQVIEVSVGLLVLVLLGVLGYLVVRSSLRPLTHVEATAAAIAGGDYSRRVPELDPRTEVGRLARAFNAMLGQIESAFRSQAASESAARASEERMRRFVADASHELRTPLTSIRGFAELYRQGAVTEPVAVARNMSRVEGEARRMGMLVDDMLLLARLDQQRPLESTPVDLLTLAADAVHDGRAVAPDRCVELRILPGETAPVVRGDEARLRQVVSNLVSNALTHTPAGTAVTVSVGADDGSAVLEVADAGPGIPPEDQQRIFERFYRADESRTRAQGGSGLGLSIVAALVGAHGGSVNVSSRPGAGATFRVVLPLADAPTGPAADTSGAAAAPDARASSSTR